MTDSYAIRTPKLTDRRLLDFLFALKTNVTVESGNVRLAPGIDIDFGEIEVTDEQLSKIYGDRHAITHSNVRIASGIQVLFYRGVCENISSPASNRQPSPYYDEFFVQINDRWKNKETLDQLVSWGLTYKG